METAMSVDLITLFVTLEQFTSTEDDPTSVADIEGEFDVELTELVNALGELEDAGLIASEGRGVESVWFIAIPGVNSENAADVAEAYLKTSESQTGLTREQVKAELPSVVLEILAEAPVTPVDMAERAKSMAAHPSALVTLPKPFVSVEHESDIAKNGLELEIPEFIPEKPEGVNDNVWYMAHAAITQTARDWWRKRVDAARNAFILANPGTLITAQELAERL